MNPVVVGLDPGQNGPQPLDPAFGSGRRLASLCGVEPGEFLRRVDRINLHSAPGRLPAKDRGAGRNLLPVLRGRRVVALGRRVAGALGAIGGWFTWRVVAGGFVAAPSPHPSGLSRWWNDAGNAASAETFWRRLLLPCIHLEGPDGSGKTTLLRDLEGRPEYALTTVETDGPPESWPECLRRVNRRITPGLLCDRSSGLVSELVYGPVLRDSVQAPGGENELWRLVEAIRYAVSFVYCRPDALSPRSRPGEDPAHVRRVEKNLGRIRDRYDVVMRQVAALGARVVVYDRTPRSLEDVRSLVCAG